MKKQENLPTPEEFVAFWNASTVFTWRSLLPHLLYVSGFALYAVIVSVVVKPGRFWAAYLGFAIVYILLVPYLWMRIVWKRDARFIRCPRCGDWLGRDASGAWSGPNPKWKSISQTGVCIRCGQRLLSAGGQDEPDTRNEKQSL